MLTFAKTYDPFYGLWRPFLPQLDDLFEVAPQSEGRRGQGTFTPHFEAHEEEGQYVLSFDVPGIHRGDIDIEITGNRLVVSGERKANGKHADARSGKFQQSFTLPEGITAQNLSAECRDGVLTLFIQKPEAQKPVKIKLSEGGKPSFLKNLMGDKKGNQQAALGQGQVEVTAAAN